LVTQLVARLTQTRILTGVTVERIDKKAAKPGYTVTLSDGQTIPANALIVTTPAFVTARLLAAVDSDLAALHAAIPYASSATISLAYAQSDIPQPLEGYGYVVPRVENTELLACTWTSNKWAGRAPQDYALLRVFVGRYGRRDVLQDTDADLLALAYSELRQILGITASAHLQRIYRWPQSMPQYMLGHLDRLTQIEHCLAQQPGLFVAGAAYRGVGIPDCIRSGEQVAGSAVEYLK
jgi:oxygen-dependent protoporphyrinogen oxidase